MKLSNGFGFSRLEPPVIVFSMGDHKFVANLD